MKKPRRLCISLFEARMASHSSRESMLTLTARPETDYLQGVVQQLSQSYRAAQDSTDFG
jgi:hypothetical protein